MTKDKPSRVVTLITAALISGALVAPFVVLELWYGSHNYSSFPYPLFAMLWLLPAAFIITIAPLVRTVRTGGSVLAQPVTLMVRIGFLALVALFWIGLVKDQLPCFLGVPNCD